MEASWFDTGCEGSILNWTQQGGIQNSRCGIQTFFVDIICQFFDGMTFYQERFLEQYLEHKDQMMVFGS